MLNDTIAVIRGTQMFLGTHKWITKLFFNNTQQRKFFICSFEYGLFLVLQDSWCLGLLHVWDEMA